MLEKLEGEIVSLQARYRDLASSLQHSQPNGNGRAGGGKRKRTSAPAKKKVARAAAKKSKQKEPAPLQLAEFEQLELPEQEPGSNKEQQQGRVLGKRQALGKSLVQLRKMSAWRTTRSTEE